MRQKFYIKFPNESLAECISAHEDRGGGAYESLDAALFAAQFHVEGRCTIVNASGKKLKSLSTKTRGKKS